METKLIKLSDTHYIVVDDSEIKKVPCLNIAHRVVVIPTDLDWAKLNKDNLKVITYSTKTLEGVKTISLSEVEEAIYGYSAENIAANSWNLHKDLFSVNSKKEFLSVFKTGFKAHQKLVKDKLFTVEDIKKAFRAGSAYSLGSHEYFQQTHLNEKEYIQSILQTEWGIKFNEQGKLELI